MELLLESSYTLYAATILSVLAFYFIARRISSRLFQSETDTRTFRVGSTPAVAELRRELRRAHRHSSLVSILIVEFPVLVELTKQVGLPYVEAIQRDITNIIHARLRGDDQVCTLEVGKYLLILPGTDEGGARHVRGRLAESLTHYRTSQRLNIVGGVRVAEAVQVQFKRLTSRPGAFVTPEKLYAKLDSTGERLERPVRNLQIDGLIATGTDKN